ncbi:MAG TPA: tetraacyldisaccharide 4'-kinase [Gemmataceae bacterium]|nr:tetraacyldisaccharide 4'-kinase [Gemmataceae bacterium]
MAISGDYYRALVSGERRGVVPALERGGLLLASLPYGAAVRLRNWLYDRRWKRSQRVPVPVVSVGNLTLGGTGKTPCVEYVARFYRQLDLRVAILSRGYGGGQGINDEAMVLEENLPDVPHYQGADRVALARIAVEESESEVLVLDDGFQHRRLARDLDLVLIDATNPWGHGRLFPRGLLREPPSSLRRAGVVVLTRCDQVDETQRGRLKETVARLAPGVPVVETRHRPLELVNGDQATAVPELLTERSVAAFCGIGNPEAFRRTLIDLGADVVAFRTFPDHHAYTRADVEDLRHWASRQATDCVVVTTQKDMVKLRLAQLGGRPLWALRIGLHIEAGQEQLDHKLQAVVRGRGASTKHWNNARY